MARSRRGKSENIFEPLPLKAGKFEVAKRPDAEWYFTDYGLEAEQAQLENPSSVKMGVFYCLLLIAFCTLSYKLFNIQVARGFEYRLQAEGNRIRSHLFEAPRGS